MFTFPISTFPERLFLTSSSAEKSKHIQAVIIAATANTNAQTKAAMVPLEFCSLPQNEKCLQQKNKNRQSDETQKKVVCFHGTRKKKLT